MKFSTSVSIILAIGALFIAPSTGIKCYECFNPKESYCDIHSPKKFDKIPKVDCDEKGHNLTLCAKYFYADGRVGRGCSGEYYIGKSTTPSTVDACYGFTESSDIYCYCETDYCNEAGTLKLTAALILAPVIGILTYFLST